MPMRSGWTCRRASNNEAEVFFDFLLALALFAPALFAHDARPVVVTITEQLPAAYQFSIRVPDTVEANNQPALAWPVGCMEQNRVSRLGGAMAPYSVICRLQAT